jgi:hypothetical protein
VASAAPDSDRWAIIEDEKKGDAESEFGTSESGDGEAPINDAAGQDQARQQNRRTK